MAVLVAIFLLSCRPGPPPGNPGGGEAVSGGGFFTDITEVSGIRFSHSHGGGARLSNILESSGGGVSFCDLDDDGRLDLFLVSGTRLDGDGNLLGAPDSPRNAYYHQETDGRFVEMTRAAGLEQDGYGMGAFCADYDNDGDTDLLVTRYGPDSLFRNDGNGQFTDVGKEAGIADARWSASAAFGDIDGDGDLDLYVSHYLRFRPNMVGVHSSALSKREGFRFFPGPRDYEGVTDSLYRNMGNGRFEEITEEAGLLSGGKGMGVAFSDFDGDGDLDIYVANDKTANFLYWNDGKGQFTEGAFLAGVAVSEDGEESAGMGLALGDYDGDEDEDLFVTNMVLEYNAFYRNEGDQTFQDLTPATGLAEDSYRFVGFGTGFLDYDNDGLLDLLVLNGHVVDYIEGYSTSMSFQQEPFLYRNDGVGHFVDVSKRAGLFFRHRYVGRGLAFGDVDNDGDIDLLVGTNHGQAYLLRNDVGNASSWIDVKARGTDCNRDGIGALVSVVDGTLKQVAMVRAQYSYLANNDPRVHFGLGARTMVDAVEIRWPCGKVERIEKVPARRHLLAEEGRGIRVFGR